MTSRKFGDYQTSCRTKLPVLLRPSFIASQIVNPFPYLCDVIYEQPLTCPELFSFILNYWLTVPPIQVVSGSWKTVSKSESWTLTLLMTNFLACCLVMLLMFNGSIWAARWPRTWYDLQKRFWKWQNTVNVWNPNCRNPNARGFRIQTVRTSDVWAFGTTPQLSKIQTCHPHHNYNI